MKLGVQPVFIVLQQWLNSRYKILLWQYQQWSRVLQFWRLYCEQYTIFRKCAYSLVFLRILEPDSWHLTLKWLKSCRCIQSWEPPPNIMFSSQYWCQHWGTLALCCVFWIINEENLNICCAAYSLFSDTKIITSYFANSTAHSTRLYTAIRLILETATNCEQILIQQNAEDSIFYIFCNVAAR